MTEEIMPREDRMGKILTFIGGCLAGVIGVFTVAAMSELSSPTQTPVTSEEDAEDEVKWAGKVICNFGVYAGTPLGEMMQDARGYQTIKWLVQRYKGQNQEIQKAAKILLDHEKEMQKAA